MVDQTCVPEIAVPTLRVPRRGTAWVNRAVHDIALAELAMVPCVPGIHDLQQACSHPKRVAMGEAVSGGTLWLVHAQRAPGAGGQRSDTARKARQARCGCVRRRSCKTEANCELADATVRCIDSVQFGGPPARAQVPAVMEHSPAQVQVRAKARALAADCARVLLPQAAVLHNRVSQ